MSHPGIPVTVSGRILGLIAHVGSRRGVDAGAVLASLGIDAGALSAPEARVPIAHEDALWDAMAAATRDPYFGLHAAADMPEGSFDVMEYAIRTSATARAATLPRGAPSLADMARALHMSPRTLQRRLDAKGVRFQALVDAMRRELAERYLDDARLSIAEVAYLLGFSEVSAFHRACKRWTGKSPGQLRGGIPDT